MIKRILQVIALFALVAVAKGQPVPPTTYAVMADKTAGTLVAPTNFFSGNGVLLSSGSYANPTWISSLAWTKITGTPTSAAGYGITNGAVIDTFGADGIAFFVPATRTIAGNALSGNVTQDQITGLASTGLVKRTAANTLAIATAGTDYLTSSTGVSSITGTAGQITASASTGAVTLSIPTAMTGITSVTAPASTDLTLNAGSGNQNVNLLPTGTGYVGTVMSTGSGTIAPATYRIGSTDNSSSWLTNTNWGNLDFYSGDASGAGATVRARIGARMDNALGSAVDLVFSASGGSLVDYMFLQNNGNLLLGSATDNANGLFQIAASTTATKGIAFGNDTPQASIYRSAASTLTTPGTWETSAGSGTVAIHVGAVGIANGGGYLGSAGAARFFSTAGGYFNGSWTASATSFSGLDLGATTGGINVYGNTGLTAGNTFTPTTVDIFGPTGTTIGGSAAPTSGQLGVAYSTASTSTTTGAIVDSGGLGVAGDTYIGGKIVAGTTITAQSGFPQMANWGGSSNLPSYVFNSNIGLRYNISGSQYEFINAGNNVLSLGSGYFSFSPVARSSGAASYFTLTAPADTGITTATESIGVNILGATRTWVDGTVGTQREYYFGAPTYNKTTTSATFTTAATVDIGGAPVAGAGVTITNPYALRVESGQSFFGGNVQFQSVGVNSAAGAGYGILLGGYPGVTGGTTYGMQIAFNPSSASDTVSAIGYDCYEALTGSSTVPLVTNYRANGGTPGTATITEYRAFDANTVATAATAKAFSGSFSSGSNQYNLYMGGSAPNYLAGITGIGALPQAGIGLYVAPTVSGSTAMALEQLGTLSPNGNGQTVRGIFSQPTIANGAFTTPAYNELDLGTPTITGTALSSGAMLNIQAPAAGMNAISVASGAVNLGTGTTTIGGTAAHTGSVAFNGGITASSAVANDFSGSTGTFKTSTGAVTIGPGAVTISGATTHTNADTFQGTNATTAVTITQTARTSGVLPYAVFNTPADTGITAATESNDIQFGSGATRTWATTGTVALERTYKFTADTLASASASQTFTKAATVDITGAPVQGSNAIITQGFALNVEAGNSSFGGLIQHGGLVRTTAGFTAASNTTLTNITALTQNVLAGQSYHFRVWAPTTATAAGGIQFAIAGTATATNITYEGYIDGATKTRASALAAAVCSSASATTGTATIEGTIQVNAAGTLTVQFAQNTTNASASTVLQGATFEVFQTSN